MTPNEVAAQLAIVAESRRLAKLAAAAEKQLIAHFAAGGELPGHEVVHCVGRERVWKNEVQAKALLLVEGFMLEQIMETARLKSVAQIERITVRQQIEGLWTYPQRGVAVMPLGSGLERAEYKQ